MKYIPILAVLLFPLLFISCDSLLGVNITKERQMKKLNAKISGYTGSGAVISEVTFRGADERSPSIMGNVSVRYSNQKHTEYEMTIKLDQWKVIKNDPTGKPAQAGGIAVEECDFSLIPEIIRQAIEKLEAENMTYAGTEWLSVHYEGKAPAYRFVLDGRPNGSGLTSKGRYAAVYYREVSYEIDESGQWRMKTGEKLKTRRGGL